MRIVSYNINGIRSALNKGFLDWLKTNPADIRQAIAGTGYDADEVKAMPKAVAKLDECCRPK